MQLHLNSSDPALQGSDAEHKAPRRSKSRRPTSPRSKRSHGSALLILDSALRATGASPAYEKMFARSLKDFEGAYFSDLHATAPIVHEKLLACLYTGSPAWVEDFLPDSALWIGFRITRQRTHLNVELVDISERRSTEIQMRVAAEEERASLEACEIGIARISLDGRWLAMNARGREITGLASEDFNQKRFSDLSGSIDHLVDAEQFADIVSGAQKSLLFERQIQGEDGSIRWAQFRISVAKKRTGRPRFFVAVIEDTTERKEAEESLQFALEASQIAEWDFDPLNNRTRRSCRFDKIFGYATPRDEWRFEDFISHIHIDDRKFAERQFVQALTSGADCMFDARITWPDHSIHWISIKGRVYQNERGQAARIAGLVLDVTQVKVAEQEIQSAKFAAEDANREKSNFLANMSHEIRTPLGAILGFTEILKNKMISAEDSARYLNIISRNGASLAKLIDDILDLSKVEAGFLEIEPSLVDVEALLGDVITLLKIKADAKRLELVIMTGAQKLPLIAIDFIRVRQILMNVIGNAIKFTEKGSVTVHLEMTEIDDSEERLLSVRVADTGRGLSQEQGEKLFQPFTQADSSTSREYGGTGLGLALSKRIAIAMGGQLTLESSEPGVGSTFLFQLRTVIGEPGSGGMIPSSPKREAILARVHDQSAPAQIPAKETNESTRPLCASSLRNDLHGLRILLAEDSVDNQVLIKRLLTKLGAFVDVVADRVLAVEAASREDYGLVLMDMQMPRLDGYSAARQLRKQGFGKKIIALTAHAMRHDRTKCLEAGCDDYLSKPIDPVALFALIQRHTC